MVKTIRIILIALFVLLITQFLSGMWLNLFGTFPSNFLFAGMMAFMLYGGGSVLMFHMISGGLIILLAVINLVVALISADYYITIPSLGGVASVTIAAAGGIAFMFSGFSNNIYSYFMATGFIFAVIAYSAETYFFAKRAYWK